MNALLATVGAYTGAGLLLASGISHTTHQGAFRRFVARQAVWPQGLVALVAAAVTLSELIVGLLSLLSNVAAGRVMQPAPTGRTALFAATLLYLAFGCYSLLLLKRRPGVPCACSHPHADHPVNVWVTVRALVLAVGCLYAALDTTRVLRGSPTAEFLLCMLASITFVALAWSLPTALHDPSQRAFPHPSPLSQARDEGRPRDQQEVTVQWTSRLAR
jgi:Methylamine utilisation protein MauE